MKKNKVFIGINNIAGIASYTAEALKKVGIHARSFSYKKHVFGYECDNENIYYIPPEKRKFLEKLFINKYTIPLIRRFQRLHLLIKSILLFDTFIFISTDTIFLNQSDLPILNFFNKKISFIFVGCPERNPFDLYNLKKGSFCSFCKDIALKNYLKCDYPKLKNKKIEKIEKYADIIFSQPDSTGFLENPKNVNNFYILSKKQPSFNIEKFDRKKIKICHFPSNNKLKGTKFVDKAIKSMDSAMIEYYSKRMSNYEVRKHLLDTNILIDQFGSGYGLLTVEALASGCVVICKIADWFRDDYPEMPIISCKEDEIQNVLQSLIEDREKMKALAKLGVQYFNKVHSLSSGGKYYKDIIGLN